MTTRLPIFTDEYQAGYKAAVTGAPCPYPRGTRAWELWMAGEEAYHADQADAATSRRYGF